MSAIDQQRFTALGREWVARFDYNAMAEIEEADANERGFLEIVSPMLVRLDEADRADPAKQLAAVKSIRMSDIRTILRQSLQAVQPGTSAAETGEIIGAIGFTAALGIVAWAVSKALAVGEADQDEAEGNAPAQPKKGGRASKTG